MKEARFHFLKAKPVWQMGHTHTMNRTVSFCAQVSDQAKDSVLCAAASCSYVVLVNGTLIAHGPQRTAHGFYCVDEIPLGAYLTQPENTVAVRVAGYNCNSFAYLDQPSFFCGEIRVQDRVIAYTANPMVGFTGHEMSARVQKVHRYSYQRPFGEVYDFMDGDFACETGAKADSIKIWETEPKIFMNRTAPYGDYEMLTGVPVQHGTVTHTDRQIVRNAREFRNIGPRLKGFVRSEWTSDEVMFYDSLDFSSGEAAAETGRDIRVAQDGYIDMDFGRNYAGVFEFEVEGSCDRLIFAFDELLSDGKLDPFRLTSTAMVVWKHLNGKYRLVCAEPYTLRYLRIIALGGEVTIRGLHMKKSAFPSSRITAKYSGDDETMGRIFEAARETFCANAVDIYMDCPSRERAGWLCDSFFTGRVEKLLTGKSQLERAFLSNFLLPDSFRNLPRGMLPMCYPADSHDGGYIVNWAMWYVLELAEYSDRSGDDTLAAEAKAKMFELDSFLRSLENEFGLLEDIPGWVFVEWSKANELVQGVNFPSNMLYTGFKRAMAKLYGEDRFQQEAEKLTDTIRRMALHTNGFFCDNATRQPDGTLKLSGECTEACQYYAFFFGTATPGTHPELWRILLQDFGPDRVKNGLYPEIYPANAFIGNYLRLDVLCRHGYMEQLAENIRGYFAYMADTTGTLWGHVSSTASCNHGFASHVIYWMDKLGMIARDE